MRCTKQIYVKLYKQLATLFRNVKYCVGTKGFFYFANIDDYKVIIGEVIQRSNTTLQQQNANVKYKYPFESNTKLIWIKKM